MLTLEHNSAALVQSQHRIRRTTMASFNAAKGRYADETGAFTVLPSDVYRMKIKKADIQEDQYAEPNEDGSRPDQLVLCWEVSEAAPEQDEAVVGLSVWQRMAPWYGEGRRGPSRFKTFVDNLIAQGILDASIDVWDMDTDWFVGIEQRVNVEEYTKTMGPNKGQPGNKVVAVLPLVAKKTTPKPIVRPGRNLPRPVPDTSDIPF